MIVFFLKRRSGWRLGFFEDGSCCICFIDDLRLRRSSDAPPLCFRWTTADLHLDTCACFAGRTYTRWVTCPSLLNGLLYGLTAHSCFLWLARLFGLFSLFRWPVCCLGFCIVVGLSLLGFDPLNKTQKTKKKQISKIYVWTHTYFLNDPFSNRLTG